jgi:hypothetical protein
MFEPIILFTRMISTYEHCRGSARQPSHFCSGKSSQKPATPSLATSQRADTRLRKATQLAPLGQGLPVYESIRPRGQAEGVRQKAVASRRDVGILHCLSPFDRGCCRPGMFSRQRVWPMPTRMLWKLLRMPIVAASWSSNGKHCLRNSERSMKSTRPERPWHPE